MKRSLNKKCMTKEQYLGLADSRRYNTHDTEVLKCAQCLKSQYKTAPVTFYPVLTVLLAICASLHKE